MAGTTVAIIIILTICGGIAVGYTIRWFVDKKKQRSADQITKDAEKQAENIIKEAQIQAKEEKIKSREEFEKSTQEQRQELQKAEERLDNRENNIEKKADVLASREKDVQDREKAVQGREEKIKQNEERLQGLIDQELEKLENIAGMNRDEAKQQLMSRLSEELKSEQGAMIRKLHEEGRQRLEREAQEIMTNVMQRYASDCATERTTSTITLPNDEMKGRIIGREGRNIRAIENATGVELLVDDTPEAVVISCFDPVRREIGRITLERLIEDGRIHPTRIEEIVTKVRKEVDNNILQTGQDIIEELGLTRINQHLTRLIGRLKFRYSYSQNVLQHSKECAYFMGDIAAQLELDEYKARRIGLFHDIGKAIDHEVEGPHAMIGRDVLKRAGEDEEVLNAVASHHEDVAANSLLGVLANVADTLSASRPGARVEGTEIYLKRLEALENIGRETEGVEECYAIQAGRELRVAVKPEHIDENQAAYIAREIANRVEKEITYPGQVKVNVMRETRAVEYAR